MMPRPKHAAKRQGRLPPPLSARNLLRDLALPTPCIICFRCQKLATTHARAMSKMQRASGVCQACQEKQAVLPGSGIYTLDPRTYEAVWVA